ncbi:hypothetical protein HY642_02425 [Candidatus Woesearchaeota archaeon]|nr:hypothetical protein [Candidatus Woesearchaeota archaeon]
MEDATFYAIVNRLMVRNYFDTAKKAEILGRFVRLAEHRQHLFDPDELLLPLQKYEHGTNAWDDPESVTLYIGENRAVFDSQADRTIAAHLGVTGLRDDLGNLFPHYDKNGNSLVYIAGFVERGKEIKVLTFHPARGLQKIAPCMFSAHAREEQERNNSIANYHAHLQALYDGDFEAAAQYGQF